MNNIVFEHVVKAYGKNVIVNDLNMEIREGERLILLGPSGCGKSTTLRMSPVWRISPPAPCICEAR